MHYGVPGTLPVSVKTSTSPAGVLAFYFCFNFFVLFFFVTFLYIVKYLFFERGPPHDTIIVDCKVLVIADLKKTAAYKFGL